MQSRLERTYGRLFTYMKLIVNPFKKAIMQAECAIHKQINIQALEILKNDNYLDAYTFFSDYIDNLNHGVVWADQDLKSSGHFYNPVKGKGLYGNNNALSLALEYYSDSLSKWKAGEIEDSMFSLGATLHLVQDVTIPQHANIRLLDSHRQFENFIRKTYLYTPRFVAHKGGYYIESIEEAVKCNARNAIKIYSRLKDIENINKRYYSISKFILPLAQKTTAGCYMRFYRDVSKLHNPC